MVAAARAKASSPRVEVEVRQGDAGDPAYALASCDVVLARHVLWALPDPEQALARWVRLLRPGGRLVLVEGRWSTGAGLRASELEALVRSHRAHVETRASRTRPCGADRRGREVRRGQPALSRGHLSDRRGSILGMGRGRWVVVGLALVAVVAAGLGVVLALPPRQTAEVAVPGRAATPEEVVRAYLSAPRRPRLRHRPRRSWPASPARRRASMCGDVGGVRRADVRRASAGEPVSAGLPAGTQVVEVPVTLDVDWRLLHGAGERGPHAWGYVLARTSSGQPWRIVDEGAG